VSTIFGAVATRLRVVNPANLHKAYLLDN